MRLAGTVLRFFVYSNIFIAVCAVLMVWQTYLLWFPGIPGMGYTGFVFFSTITSYSFHWYLSTPTVLSSERVVWQKKFHNLHLALMIAGIAGVAWFFWQLLPHAGWLAIIAVITFLYSAPKIPHPFFRALRKVALGKTIFLAAVWTIVTAVLPIVTTDTSWHTGHTLYAVSRFFFIYCICILFDYRDREDDRLNGIRSLITWLSEKGIWRLFMFSFAVYVLSSCLLPSYGLPVPALMLLLVPALPLLLLYRVARSNFSDLLYYFLLDGLMALSAVLSLLIRFD